MSKTIDFEDYSVTQKFFNFICEESGITCNVDRFADNLNTKLKIFNSSSFCLGTSGVDCFLYDWAPPFINWLFPPPRLIMRAVNHLKLCKGKGLLLAPEWKSASFYPYLNSFLYSKQGKISCLTYKGKNLFKLGADKDSFFGPKFNCAVNIWILDFTT